MRYGRTRPWTLTAASPASPGSGRELTRGVRRLNDNDIKDATNAGYTPVAADDNEKFLRVTASYTDAEGSGKTAVGTPTDLAGTAQAVVKVRNLAPVFTDEDTTDDAPGIQVNDREWRRTLLRVPRDPVGATPVVATDEADADTSDDDSKPTS